MNINVDTWKYTSRYVSNTILQYPWPVDIVIGTKSNSAIKNHFAILDRISMEDPGIPKRVFPPFYNATGSIALDRLAFFHVLERLKVPSVFLSGFRISYVQVRPRKELDG